MKKSSDKQLARAHAYAMSTFSQWLSELDLCNAERELIRSTIALAFLHGGTEAIEDIDLMYKKKLA